MRRPDQLENTQNRVALLGFDVDQRDFPAHSVASLPDDAEGGSWAAFWERNQQREPLELEAYLAQLQEWEEAGGLARAWEAGVRVDMGRAGGGGGRARACEAGVRVHVRRACA